MMILDTFFPPPFQSPIAGESVVRLLVSGVRSNQILEILLNSSRCYCRDSKVKGALCVLYGSAGGSKEEMRECQKLSEDWCLDQME